ncbi:MAG: DNA recombination protein RmuC [Planctomycetota bacterium]
MEYFIAALLVVILVLIVTGLLRNAPRRGEEALRNAVNEQFIAFQSSIQQTMDTTRREVESSKTVLSQNTIKTLETIKAMEKTLQEVMAHQEEAQKLGGDLKSLLEKPKLRGNYGEEILEEMLDRVLPKGMWERQFMIDGRDMVDAVVRYRGVIIPIDAKFPRENFDRFQAATDAAVKKGLWKTYEDAVRVQIRSIGAKYVKPDRGTAEFALMFIPAESIYYETVAAGNGFNEESDLYRFAREQRVFMVSPNTFYAFLQVLILGIRNLEIIKSAKALQEHLAAIERSFGQFYDRFEDMGARVEKAAEAYRVGKGHIERFKKGLEATIRLELKDDAPPPLLPGSGTQ